MFLFVFFIFVCCICICCICICIRRLAGRAGAREPDFEGGWVKPASCTASLCCLTQRCRALLVNSWLHTGRCDQATCTPSPLSIWICCFSCVCICLCVCKHLVIKQTASITSCVILSSPYGIHRLNCFQLQQIVVCY